MEIWKDIGIVKGIDYTGLYQVSNLGRVKNRHGRYNIFSKKRQGYLEVSLYNNNNVRCILVHRLVMLVFVGPCPEGKEVNHKGKNGDKTNNKLENLEYCTKSENLKHRYSILGLKQWNIRKVKQYTKDGEFIKTWDSIRDVEKQLGIFNQNIGKCCNGKRKSTGGYKWKYFT